VPLTQEQETIVNNALHYFYYAKVLTLPPIDHNQFNDGDLSINYKDLPIDVKFSSIESIFNLSIYLTNKMNKACPETRVFSAGGIQPHLNSWDCYLFTKGQHWIKHLEFGLQLYKNKHLISPEPFNDTKYFLYFRKPSPAPVAEPF
jgi:hypothetical protein